jgi:hypothetical protein
MAVSGEHPTQAMSAAAGLHADDARRKLPRQSNQRLPPHLTPHDGPAGCVEADDTADVLAEIDAKDRDIHSDSSF